MPGPAAWTKAHDYRLQAPGFLVEYSSSGAHMHTLLRTEGDFGPPASAP